MGYNSTTGKITSPISIGDVATAFDYSSGDLGTLITNVSINKYAKYKPVRSSITGALNAVNLANVDYGFNMSKMFCDGNPTPSFSTFFTNLAVWEYQRPRGVDQSHTEWFRLLDFNGYNENAVAPYTKLTGNITINSVPASGEIEVFVSKSSSANAEIQIESFGSYGSGGTGTIYCMYKYSYSTSYKICLAPASLYLGDYKATLQIPTNYSGNIDCVWILSTVPVGALNSDGTIDPDYSGVDSAVTFTLPDCVFTITVDSTAGVITLVPANLTYSHPFSLGMDDDEVKEIKTRWSVTCKVSGGAAATLNVAVYSSEDDGQTFQEEATATSTTSTIAYEGSATIELTLDLSDASAPMTLSTTYIKAWYSWDDGTTYNRDINLISKVPATYNSVPKVIFGQSGITDYDTYTV